jgi:hypothetical protein
MRALPVRLSLPEIVQGAGLFFAVVGIWNSIPVVVALMPLLLVNAMVQ